jgi:tRNA G46 methylase TrmB
MNSALVESYEQVPYDDLAFFEVSPDCLFAIATLAGMSPTPVKRRRVLEIGCARAGNLLSLALPEALFVGIDISPRQIAAAHSTAKALDLTNVELKVMSLWEIDPDLGHFD